MACHKIYTCMVKLRPAISITESETLLHFAGHNVVFIHQPQDTQVDVRKNAFFPCTYRGLRRPRPPYWVVNQTRYPESALPTGLTSNHSGLTVHNVNISMNGTKYKCCFEFFIRTIEEICSSEGTLIINNAGQ